MSVDIPLALHLCAGHQKLHLSCPRDTNHAADECTVALCVPVSVVKQRRLDLIDKNCNCEHRSFPHVDTGHLSSTTTGMSTSLSETTRDAVPLPTKGLQAIVMCIVKSKTSRVQPPLLTTKADNQGEHNAECDVISKPALHMPLPMSTARTATSTPEPPKSDA